MEGRVLTSSNLAVRVGMKYFFQKGRGWTKGRRDGGGGGFFTLILDFHEKEEYQQSDFQFV